MTEADYALAVDNVTSVKGHLYCVPTIEVCDQVLSLLDERLHRAEETGRLLDWIPAWREDIDRLLDRRLYLELTSGEVSCRG